jgi:hypothetical protein
MMRGCGRWGGGSASRLVRAWWRGDFASYRSERPDRDRAVCVGPRSPCGTTLLRANKIAATTSRNGFKNARRRRVKISDMLERRPKPSTSRTSGNRRPTCLTRENFGLGALRSSRTLGFRLFLKTGRISTFQDPERREQHMVRVTMRLSWLALRAPVGGR